MFSRGKLRAEREDDSEVGEYADGNLRSARHLSKWFYVPPCVSLLATQNCLLEKEKSHHDPTNDPMP